MIKKTIEIVIGAKNYLQKGLASSFASFSDFGKKLQATWSKIWAPAAVAFAVGAAVKKVADMIDSGMAKVITRQNEIKKGNLDAHFNLVSKSIEAQAKAYSDLNKEIASQAKHEKDLIGLLADREAKEARLAALREMEGKGTEERSEIEKRFEAEQKITSALQEQTKAQMEQSEVNKRISANDDERKNTAQELADAEKRYAEAANDTASAVEKQNKWAEGLAGKNKTLYAPKTTAAIADRMKQSETAMTREFELIQKLREKEKDLERERGDLSNQREEKDRSLANAILDLEVQKKEQQIKASGEAAKAREEYERAVAEDAKKRAEEHVKAVENATEKIKELTKKQAEEEKRLAKESLDSKKSALEKELEKKQEIANKTIAEIIKEAREGKKIESEKSEESDRIRKLMGKQQHGVRLSRRDQEFMDAFRERERAGQAVGRIKGQISEAEKQLAAMDKQTTELVGIKDQLATYNGQLQQLLTQA